MYVSNTSDTPKYSYSKSKKERKRRPIGRGKFIIAARGILMVPPDACFSATEVCNSLTASLLTLNSRVARLYAGQATASTGFARGRAENLKEAVKTMKSNDDRQGEYHTHISNNLRVRLHDAAQIRPVQLKKRLVKGRTPN